MEFGITSDADQVSVHRRESVAKCMSHNQGLQVAAQVVSGVREVLILDTRTERK